MLILLLRVTQSQSTSKSLTEVSDSSSATHSVSGLLVSQPLEWFVIVIGN